MKYDVYAGQEVIGWSELECGDPPMGVVCGVFYPYASYSKIEATVHESTRLHFEWRTVDRELIVAVENKIAAIGLAVIAPDGAEMGPAGSVILEDYFVGATGRLVYVWYLDCDIYSKYFHDHYVRCRGSE